jgi:hypothetical protein
LGGWLGGYRRPLLAAAPLALAFAACWLPGLPRLPRRLLGRGGVAVAVYLLGVVGGALLSQRLLAAYGVTSLPYLLGAALGETFEMGALVGLVALLLAHLRDTWGAVPIHLRPRPRPTSICCRVRLPWR